MKFRIDGPLVDLGDSVWATIKRGHAAVQAGLDDLDSDLNSLAKLESRLTCDDDSVVSSALALWRRNDYALLQQSKMRLATVITRAKASMDSLNKLVDLLGQVDLVYSLLCISCYATFTAATTSEECPCCGSKDVQRV